MPRDIRQVQPRPLPRGRLPLDTARSRLAILWVGGESLILVILVMQSLLGHYQDKVQEAWDWALSTLMPTVEMIITVLGYTALNPSILASVVHRDFLILSVWLCALYLTLILLTLSVQPIVHAYGEKAVEMMRQ